MRRLLQLVGYGAKVAFAGFRAWQSLPPEARNAILRILGLLRSRGTSGALHTHNPPVRRQRRRTGGLTKDQYMRLTWTSAIRDGRDLS